MSHLQLGIKNNEFLSYGYTAFRRDRTDQWREVLLIVNNKFICQQIRISERLELVAITIQKCKSALILAASYRPLKYSKEQLDISTKTTSVQFGLVMTSTCQISIEKQGLQLVFSIRKVYRSSRSRMFFKIHDQLTTNLLNHIETTHMICIANQLTGFYMMGNTGR